MNLPLSPRLLACAKHISGGIRVADIGCDHGYLGIHLLLTGKASHVIAADVNAAPLESAMKNAEKYAVADKMSFYLSDGAQNIPRNYDALICAGMGGDTIIHILENAPLLKDRDTKLVLQCQSKTPMLRRYLSDNGWHIAYEEVLRDGKFLYTVMRVLYRPERAKLTVGECFLSPALLHHDTPLLAEYYERIASGLRLAVEHQQDEEKAAILAELEMLYQRRNET